MSKRNKSVEAENTDSLSPRTIVIGAIAVIAVIAIALVATGQTGFFALPEEKGPIVPGEKGPVGTIKTFTDLGTEVELQDGKPVIRLFSTTWCPHCKWVKDSFDKVMLEYQGEIIAYHWELDIEDNLLTPEAEGSVPQSEQDKFQEFNPRGTIPTFVFGGKYLRVGNGYETEDDLAAEEAEFRAVIEALLEEAKQ